jgi:hypothetical protein
VYFTGWQVYQPYALGAVQTCDKMIIRPGAQQCAPVFYYMYIVYCMLDNKPIYDIIYFRTYEYPYVSVVI